jgi:O-antigen ligase
LYSIEIGGDEARGNLIQAGFNEFLNNPFVGSAMLIQVPGYVGAYPHNFIVEAFMATGFFGGILFLFFIIKCVKLSIKIIRNNFEIAWIALLFLQFLIFGMFSGNLFSSNLFWLMSVLLLGLSNMTMKKSRNNEKVLS